MKPGLSTEITPTLAARFSGPLIIADKIPWWLWLNTLALDAPLIAILWQTMLARCLHVPLSWAEIIILGLLGWFVYAFDYLLDSVRAGPNIILAYRHQFFRLYAKPLLILLMFVAITVAFLALLFLTPATFREGSIAAVCVAAYLVAIHLMPPASRSRWPREFAVATLFTLGTIIFVWSGSGPKHFRIVAPALVFDALCWINCAGTQYWEWQKSKSSAELRPSVSAIWLGRNVKTGTVFLGGSVLVLTFLTALPPPLSAAALVSNLALFVVAARVDDFPATVLRAVSDIALCSPALIFLLSRFR